MFIGLVANNQSLYTSLQSAGFILVFKPTVRYFENGKETVKGNVDAELVLHAAAIQYSKYTKAIIISGDGDFACLLEYLQGKDKLLHVITPNKNYSKLLKPFSRFIINAEQLRSSLEYKKDQHRRSVKTLGLSGHDDAKSVAKKSLKSNRKGKK